MFLDQIIEKQRVQIEKLQQTPVADLKGEINDLRDLVREQGEKIKVLQVCDNTTEVKTQNIESVVCEKGFDLVTIIREAMDGDVPPMPRKITPETGIRALGLPIPLELKNRLTAQQSRYEMESYKASVLSCIRIGVTILESLMPEDLDEYDPELEEAFANIFSVGNK